MSYQNILVETKGRVGIIRFNRPQALNALNAALVEELNGALEAFEADTGIGCILITGSEKAFAAGADIKEMAGSRHRLNRVKALPKSMPACSRCSAPPALSRYRKSGKSLLVSRPSRSPR